MQLRGNTCAVRSGHYSDPAIVNENALSGGAASVAERPKTFRVYLDRGTRGLSPRPSHPAGRDYFGTSVADDC